MNHAKTARWLDLLAYLLQHRFPVSREQIFQHVEGYADGDDAAKRQRFERDKRELKALGIVIDTECRPGLEGTEDWVGYRLKEAGIYLPYFELADQPTHPDDRPYRGLARLILSPAELAVLDRATRRLADHPDQALAVAASSARRKLQFDLPFPPEAMDRMLAAPLPEAGRQALAVLQTATAERKPVRCRYYSIGRDVESERIIEPYGLLFHWSHWYCVGRARDRNAVRVFRLDRMRAAEILPNEPTFEVPPGFEIREYLDRAPWELGDGPAETVVVRVPFPEWVAVKNRWQDRVAVDEARDDVARMTFEVRDQGAFLRWMLTMGRRIAVESPEDVASALEGLRRDVAAQYRESSP